MNVLTSQSLKSRFHRVWIQPRNWHWRETDHINHINGDLLIECISLMLHYCLVHVIVSCLNWCAVLLIVCTICFHLSVVCLIRKGSAVILMNYWNINIRKLSVASLCDQFLITCRPNFSVVWMSYCCKIFVVNLMIVVCIGNCLISM